MNDDPEEVEDKDPLDSDEGEGSYQTDDSEDDIEDGFDDDFFDGPDGPDGEADGDPETEEAPSLHPLDFRPAAAGPDGSSRKPDDLHLKVGGGNKRTVISMLKSLGRKSHDNLAHRERRQRVQRSSSFEDDIDDQDDTDDVSLMSAGSKVSALPTHLAQGLNAPVKVVMKNKPEMEFSHLRLKQELTGLTSMLAIAGTKTAELKANAAATAAGAGQASDSEITAMGLMAAKADVSTSDLSQGAPVLCLRFNEGGSLLAAGGRDGVVRVWKVDEEREREDRAQHQKRSSASPSRSINGDVPKTPSTKPLLSHSSSLDSSKTSPSYASTSSSSTTGVSRHGFLLSSGLDAKVRLWHSARNECLCTFDLTEPSASVKFHPLDDRIFITGDSRIRVWSVPDKRVQQWFEVPRVGHNVGGSARAAERDLSGGAGTGGAQSDAKGLQQQVGYVTALAFTRDGSMVVAGTLDGDLFFFYYDNEGLRYNTQVEIRTSRTSLKGPRILSIDAMPTGARREDDFVLVSASDSKVRLFNMRDKSLVRRYVGPETKSGHIRASFSEDGKYIICGSEDKRVYIWNTEPKPMHMGGVSAAIDTSTRKPPDVQSRRIKLGIESKITKETPGSGAFTGVLSGLMHWQTDSSRSGQLERFMASSDVVICAVFAPTGLRKLLEQKQSRESTLDRRLNAADGLFIATGDGTGLINIYENEIPVPARQSHVSAVAMPITIERPGDSGIVAPILVSAMHAGSPLNGSIPEGLGLASGSTEDLKLKPSYTGSVRNFSAPVGLKPSSSVNFPPRGSSLDPPHASTASLDTSKNLWKSGVYEDTMENFFLAQRSAPPKSRSARHLPTPSPSDVADDKSIESRSSDSAGVAGGTLAVSESSPMPVPATVQVSPLVPLPMSTEIFVKRKRSQSSSVSHSLPARDLGGSGGIFEAEKKQIAAEPERLGSGPMPRVPLKAEGIMNALRTRIARGGTMSASKPPVIDFGPASAPLVSNSTPPLSAKPPSPTSATSARPPKSLLDSDADVADDEDWSAPLPCMLCGHGSFSFHAGKRLRCERCGKVMKII
ncbi:hypothetical protein HK101_001240 [Irineochytrium annulatum]|nr:hypothetical protein HK101_001240 [Irineochytrium annulatum]